MLKMSFEVINAQAENFTTVIPLDCVCELSHTVSACAVFKYNTKTSTIQTVQLDFGIFLSDVQHVSGIFQEAGISLVNCLNIRLTRTFSVVQL